MIKQILPEYNDCVADLKSVFQDFQASIEILSEGQTVEFETLAGRYMSCFLTMKKWNEVFPEYAAEGKLPYSAGEYGRLLEEDALIILMLELQDLYYEAVHLWYLDDSMTEAQISMEDVRDASQMLENKLNHICIPL